MKNSTDVLIEAVTTRGLPTRVTTFGYIVEDLVHRIRGSKVPIVSSAEFLKAEFIVGDDEDAEPAYTDIDSLKAVIQAMINGRFSDEDLCVVDASGSERLVSVQIGDEPNTKSLDYDLLVSTKKFVNELAKIGVEVDPEDVEDELGDLFYEHFEEHDGRKTLGSEAGYATVEFADGTTLSFKRSDGLIVVA
jgi:hypothetical protein